MKSEWFRNAKIYQILVDRFSGADTSTNKADFLGGNIGGITEKLDYLVDLGINVIWLSPFWKTDKYHGYHILDYKEVDDHFGTADDLKILIKAAHEKSLRVITDFVPNHCSSGHPFFIDAVNNRDSLYRNWFYFKKWPDDYLCFLNVKELIKLNLNNPDTAEYIIEIARYWLSFGIDGFRLDHVIGPSHKFWKRFYNEIKAVYPDRVLIGEAWGPGFSSENFKTINIRHKFIRRIFGISQENLQREYFGEMDGILDFELNKIILDHVVKGKGFTADDHFKEKVKRHFRKYPENFFLVTFLDNHDMNRFLLHCKGDFDLLLEALRFLISTGKPVAIYYGTETGMINKTALSHEIHNSDLFVREPFDWSKIDYKLFDKLKELLEMH